MLTLPSSGRTLYFFSKTPAYCKVVTKVELHSMKSFVLELFTIIKTILARCKQLCQTTRRYLTLCNSTTVTTSQKNMVLRSDEFSLRTAKWAPKHVWDI